MTYKQPMTMPQSPVINAAPGGTTIETLLECSQENDDDNEENDLDDIEL